ncbi:AAA family ATPase [Rubellimicrobium roseum]|uniref:Excinuclease n=1 Tax=Rubellimicrobium roseum TaxID=687525 RepID=A0A5C4NDB4_9RHOB|nr:AAA family ATPase [Rubellimicrobium roseum]TNC66554.1 excinuclease [Rubellimicrobium roseum]
MANRSNENKRDDALHLDLFEVKGLFGQFDYTIPLKRPERVTAIISPNGTGKTLCLRLIASLFSKSWSIFMTVDFDSILYRFSQGATLVIHKNGQVKEPQEDTALTPVEGFDDDERPTKITLSLRRADRDSIEWSPRLHPERRLEHIDRYLPFLTRINSKRWRHDYSGDVLTLEDIINDYGNLIPDNIKSGIYGKIPTEIASLIDSIHCRLIETQRLLVLKDEAVEPYPASRRRQHAQLAITQKSRKITEIIAQQITSYAALSQSLDRSFPQRVIDQSFQYSRQPSTFESSPTLLLERLKELDAERAELMEAGILDSAAANPVSLREETIDESLARVLQVYTEDTARKLHSLSPLLARLKLFKQLIDSRLVTKDVQINRERGMYVTARGSSLPLDKLSSGEQHQLVLFFELLFEIRENSLILIDEPELSLHVAWQKKFISDLLSIISLNRFDVVLATHSPQLISRWSELVVELGDVYDGGDETDSDEIALLGDESGL